VRQVHIRNTAAADNGNAYALFGNQGGFAHGWGQYRTGTQGANIAQESRTAQGFIGHTKSFLPN
jgi:hypothetical protein